MISSKLIYVMWYFPDISWRRAYIRWIDKTLASCYGTLLGWVFWSTRFWWLGRKPKLFRFYTVIRKFSKTTKRVHPKSSFRSNFTGCTNSQENKTKCLHNIQSNKLTDFAITQCRQSAQTRTNKIKKIIFVYKRLYNQVEVFIETTIIIVIIYNELKLFIFNVDYWYSLNLMHTE